MLCGGRAIAEMSDDITDQRYFVPSPYSQCKELPDGNDIAIEYLPDSAFRNIAATLCRDKFIRNGIDPDELESFRVTQSQSGPITSDQICHEDGFWTISDGEYTVNGTNDTVDIDVGGYAREQELLLECLREAGVDRWHFSIIDWFADNENAAAWAAAVGLGIADNYLPLVRMGLSEAGSAEFQTDQFLDGVTHTFDALLSAYSKHLQEVIAGEIWHFNGKF